jgi:hypothetical protein
MQRRSAWRRFFIMAELAAVPADDLGADRVAEGKEAHAGGIAACQQPTAVVFDFVNPARASLGP